MTASPLLKSSTSLTKLRGRRARPLRRAYYGSLAAFSTKPILYPGQGANFTSFIEGIFGGSVTYQAPNAGGAVTYSGRMIVFPTDAAGAPGLRMFNYNSPNWTDLATLEAAGSNKFLVMGWWKTIEVGGGNQENVFNVGNGGIARTDPKTQISLCFYQNGLSLYIAGQLIAQPIPFIPVVGSVYQIALLIEKDGAAGLTYVTAYITPQGAAAPVRIGKFSGPYAAFAALTAGGVGLGSTNLAATGTVGPSGHGFGGWDIQDLRLTQNDPLAEIMLDLETTGAATYA